MDAVNGSTIKIHHQTQNKFFVEFENSFFVLPDGKIVIGPDGSDGKKLMMEDITEGNPTQIVTHSDKISTLLFDSLTQSLLVGDYKGHVHHYKKENQSFTMIKDYGDMDVGPVLTSTQIGNFAIFRGTKRCLFGINISEQVIYDFLQKNPFLKTYSLQVCEGVGSKFYLSILGESPEYSSNASDFLNVTKLYNCNKDISEFYKLINQADALLQEKDKIINALILKIKQLESSLQKESNQKQGTNNPKKSEIKISPSSRRSRPFQMTSKQPKKKF